MLQPLLQAVFKGKKGAENYKYTEGKSYGGHLEMPSAEESLALSTLTSAPAPEQRC